MNPKFNISYISFFLLLLSHSLLSQSIIVLQPGPEQGKDALVHTIYPNSNLGNSVNTIAAAWTYNGEFGRIRSLLQFDLTCIQPQSTIDSAFLSLYYNPTCGHEGHGGSNSAYIRKVSGNWEENTVTWVTQPPASSINEVFLPASLTTYQNYENIEVTTIVQEMVDFPAQNNGFMLILEIEETYRSLTFASSDHPQGGLRPKLELFIGCRIDLGPDTLLCSDSLFSLSAGPEFIQYLWNTGATDSIINIITSGTYWVNAITEFGCFASDTIQVDFYLGAESLDLGEDTTLCFGTELTLQPGEGYDNYLWQNGSNTQNFTLTEPGLYFVTASNVCGTYTDSIEIEYYNEFIISIGSDTSICYGDELTLEPGFGFLSYEWQDGSPFPFYDVYENGIYSVTVTDINQCIAFDEITVSVHQLSLHLGNDTSICENNEITLSVPEEIDSLIWLDGLSYENDYIVNVPGTYWVDVYQNFGGTVCEANDTIIIDFLSAPHEPNLQEAYGICMGESLTLNANIGAGYEYIWNGILYDSLLSISGSGIQILEIGNICGIIIDTINVYSYPSPEVEIEKVLLDVPGEFFLKVDSIYSEILWNTGCVNANVGIEGSGFYWVDVWNEFGCKASDSIFIEPPACIHDIPSIFTPNSDFYNDYFYIENQYVLSFNIQIFNRWGEKVFVSDNSSFQWDGKKNGTPCSEGTYYYIISYTCTALKNASQALAIKGSVLLLR